MCSENQPSTSPDSTDLQEDWPRHAACLGQDLYTDDKLSSYRVAILTRHCLTLCPVATECLLSAAAEIKEAEAPQKAVQHYIRGGLAKQSLNQACRTINSMRPKDRQRTAEQIISDERTRRKFPGAQARD